MYIISAFFGALGGAFLTCMVGVWQRNSDKWKLFQEEIGLIRSEFIVIEKSGGIEAVEVIYRASIGTLIAAVQRVRPYILRHKVRARLANLLNDYRTAETSKGSGFLSPDLAGNYKDSPGDLLRDPRKAVAYLVGLLDKMDRL